MFEKSFHTENKDRSSESAHDGQRRDLVTGRTDGTGEKKIELPEGKKDEPQIPSLAETAEGAEQKQKRPQIGDPGEEQQGEKGGWQMPFPLKVVIDGSKKSALFQNVHGPPVGFRQP